MELQLFVLPNDPQAQGSAITYARRYGLMSLLCLSAEDDDGESATTHDKPAGTSGNSAGTHAAGAALPIDSSKANEFSNSRCKDCGGSIKVSLQGKPYCANKCWLPENNNFRLEFAKTKTQDIPDLVIDPAEVDKANDLSF